MSPTSTSLEQTYLGSHDLSARVAEARLIRAQAAAEIISGGMAAIGRVLRPALRPVSRPIARWRELARLRETFAALDDRTLRDLNIAPSVASEITPDALADHPLAVADRWRIANENARAAGQARTAA